ncbi:hypothetical protein PV11_00939 [Exophiala sideris]|uniref:Uncharacterized protein n=1 Tax=Exophiala sideris TaxID=1016849 RepID=A0A0D1XBD5_9EURO|nr:hypothetical protein PV11_00939 [Exophiala sideris]
MQSRLSVSYRKRSLTAWKIKESDTSPETGHPSRTMLQHRVADALLRQKSIDCRVHSIQKRNEPAILSRNYRLTITRMQDRRVSASFSVQKPPVIAFMAYRTYYFTRCSKLVTNEVERDTGVGNRHQNHLYYNDYRCMQPINMPCA